MHFNYPKPQGKIKLDPRPMRTDMTDREAASIIGGIIGCLCTTMANVDTVRRAVQWYAESDEPWAHFELLKAELGRAQNFNLTRKDGR